MECDSLVDRTAFDTVWCNFDGYAQDNIAILTRNVHIYELSSTLTSSSDRLCPLSFTFLLHQSSFYEYIHPLYTVLCRLSHPNSGRSVPL